MTERLPLRLFNSLSRTIEDFVPSDGETARVYSCGPTVYNYAHLGNLRAYVFTDTLRRTLEYAGWKVRHVINITDVGHLTSDADAGEDKMELAAAGLGKDIWEVAAFYTRAFKQNLADLNILDPTIWSVATEHVGEMTRYAAAIAPAHCYEIESGLYFDTTTVPDYGRLARTQADTDENGGESRIDPVSGKRHSQDFAIWRRSPAGEARQMEWDSPWGRGAPGWHLECSVMSRQYLGDEFDIHTGGIDHREIHHPNEIAQNQAHALACGGALEPGFTGARFWLHNNFLVGLSGKMSKSTGGFTTLQSLVARGVHPLAYRLLCLSAHYRSELEFSAETLLAVLIRLRRMAIAIERLRADAAGSRDASFPPALAKIVAAFGEALSDDLNTPLALVSLDQAIALKGVDKGAQLAAIVQMDEALGLRLATLTRAELRCAPEAATLAPAAIEARLDERQAARAAKDFARSDAIRDELLAAGVEVMDGDPLRWDWRIELN